MIRKEREEALRYGHCLTNQSTHISAEQTVSHHPISPLHTHPTPRVVPKNPKHPNFVVHRNYICILYIHTLYIYTLYMHTLYIQHQCTQQRETDRRQHAARKAYTMVLKTAIYTREL